MANNVLNRLLSFKIKEVCEIAKISEDILLECFGVATITSDFAILTKI